MCKGIVSSTVFSAVVLLGAACDGGAGSENASASLPKPTATAEAKPAVDVCSLVTAEEIAEVTGTPIAESKAEAYAATLVCNYTAQGNLTPVVSLLLAPSAPAVANSAEMAEWRGKQAKGETYGDIKFIIEPVEGLGVPAIRNEIEGAGMVTVETAAKGRLLDITTANLEWSKALAAKALNRLP